ncbi:16S rRNA (uracil(1498)-N(3))-methyltransferase [Hominifimenecus sp. rT4P-3]|uniref:16S rRNA (uracil(1498)-N(3))-methyltransferase n=1 Tax=Hominifimenecus sp. rT4P-3 TaxID=3242979 RepID=UPI003DA63A41
MYHFFVPEGNASEEEIRITGPDVNHIRNVLRMKPGEKVVISDGQDRDWYCIITEITKDFVLAKIEQEAEASELPAELILYQGLPKSDKLEFIIQKAVELGVCRIVPVQMKRSVVKWEEKKQQNKLSRWNAISESAAKQSGRSQVPEVSAVLSMEAAAKDAAELDLVLVPYENAKGMQATREAFGLLRSGMRVGIFIGPEGGLEPSEVEGLVQRGAHAISLGRRILRTETAGLVALALCMYELEQQEADTRIVDRSEV